MSVTSLRTAARNDAALAVLGLVVSVWDVYSDGVAFGPWAGTLTVVAAVLSVLASVRASRASGGSRNRAGGAHRG